MSLYKGTTPIAGLAVNKIMAGRFLLETIWSDHIINDIQYLRADTFSWQSGIVYTAVYNKLVEEYTSGTEETEDGITFRRSENGFKIADASQENAIASKYTDTGVAWYYILDTENKQFKLPRTKFNFVGLRDTAGDYVNESLPNIKGKVRIPLYNSRVNEGAFYVDSTGGNDYDSNNGGYVAGFDASRSSSTYQDNAPVQQRATQMYLYFFVGNFSQTAIEQTAGVATEALNDLNAKIDGMWSKSAQHIINSSTSLTAGVSASYRDYDISSYLPNDGCTYEVLIEILGTAGAATNLWAHYWVSDAVTSGQACSCGARSYSTVGALFYGNGILPMHSRTLRFYWSSAAGAAPIISFLRLCGYRKVR